jgi:hypothetical protein
MGITIAFVFSRRRIELNAFNWFFHIGWKAATRAIAKYRDLGIVNWSRRSFGAVDLYLGSLGTQWAVGGFFSGVGDGELPLR